jgi:glycosyltransferase involved in cell wall biosynthesis
LAQPLISIVTPAYNCAPFMRACIESVVAQAYEPFEHIVMDNASQDGSVEILKQYPHVKWVSEKDTGEANALNKALKLARGDIIGWLNADDLYEPGAFACVSREIDPARGRHLVYGSTTFVDENDRVLFTHTPPAVVDLSCLARFWRQPLRQPSMFYSGELMRTIGGFREDYHFSIDFDHWLRCARQYRFHRVDAVLSRARLRPNSKSSGTIKKQFLFARRVFEPYLTDLSAADRLALSFATALDAYPRIALMELLGRFGIEPPLRARIKSLFGRA